MEIRTLIIEDDVKIAEIQRVFTEKIDGYSVIGIAHTIDEGEEMASVLEPDLILLDIFFPDGNGLDLLRKLRSEHRGSDVVLITAAKEVEFFQEALRGGVFDYILKPLVFNRFSATLEKFKEHRDRLLNIHTISQRDVDTLLRQSTTSLTEKEEFPKGIDPITLKKVMEIMDNMERKEISAEKAGAIIGVSRTTSRRYLEYLVSTGVLIADLSYGTQGRPERVYRRS